MEQSLGGIQTFVRQFSLWLAKNRVGTCIVYRSLLLPVHADRPPIASGESTGTQSVRVGPLLFTLFGIAFSVESLITVLRANKRHRIDVIHAQGLSYAGMTAALASWLLRIPFIASTQGWTIGTMRWSYRPGLKTELVIGVEEWLGRIVTSRAEAVLSEGATSRKVQEYLHTSVDKIRITTSAVPTVLYHPPTELPRRSWILYGYIGRYSAEKNVLAFVRAFIEARKLDGRIRLLLVGDGPLGNKIRELVRGSEPAIQVEGSRADVAPVLSSLDVFVLPSLIEGSSLALLEAMASGAAIIASSIAPIREVVSHGSEALLFDPTNEESMKDAILKVAADEGLRKRLSANARARALDFDEENVYPRILDIMRSVMS